MIAAAMRKRRSTFGWKGPLALSLVLVLLLTGSGAVWTNAFGAGDRFEHLMDRVRLAIAPPPDRPIQPTVEITPEPEPTATPRPTRRPDRPGVTPDPQATPEPTPAPTPVRSPVDIRLRVDPDTMFASQVTNEWCAPAGVQIVLAIHGQADVSAPVQRRLAERLGEWESRRDARAGGWGPAAIAQALAANGVPGYEIRAYKSRSFALRDLAKALTLTHAPVVIIAWRGAHTWVMTGYRADADPTVFRDATITGTYIFDPWYPRVSTIWGPSDPPGTFQDTAEMERNWLPWKRPEGAYPDRDDLFLAVVPTMPLDRRLDRG
jgi:hypothetical protein